MNENEFSNFVRTAVIVFAFFGLGIFYGLSGNVYFNLIILLVLGICLLSVSIVMKIKLNKTREEK
jgi:hypothetical protein